MQEEIIDILNENGIKTGFTAARSEVHKKAFWHRVIVVAIIVDNNKIIIQQRAAIKDKNPNAWDISVEGHIGSGQNSLSAAAREINEELGIKLNESELKFIFSFRKKQKIRKHFKDRQFYDFYILHKNGIKENNLKLQESEVQNAKIITFEELSEKINAGELVARSEIYEELFNYLNNLGEKND